MVPTCRIICFALTGESGQLHLRFWCQFTFFPTKTTLQSRGFTLVEIMIVVVIIGLLAAMAIPAFQKVRIASQDKAVLNNMRLLAGAADQYFLEFGRNEVAFDELVGPDHYIKTFQLVAGEQYPDEFFPATPIVVSGIAGQRTLTYAN